MKKIVLVFLSISFLFVACSNEGNESSVMIRQSPEALLTMYMGSPGGGKEVLSTDSVQLIFKYFNYDSTLHGNMTVEFHDGMVTFVKDNVKIVSKYDFVGDSLYTYKTDGSKVFIACGTTEELYLTQGFCRYPNLNHDATQDSVYTFVGEALMDVDKALKLSKYNSLSDMSSESDSLIWLNVKYTFK